MGPSRAATDIHTQSYYCGFLSAACAAQREECLWERQLHTRCWNVPRSPAWVPVSLDSWPGLPTSWVRARPTGLGLSWGRGCSGTDEPERGASDLSRQHKAQVRKGCLILLQSLFLSFMLLIKIKNLWCQSDAFCHIFEMLYALQAQTTFR